MPATTSFLPNIFAVPDGRPSPRRKTIHTLLRFAARCVLFWVTELTMKRLYDSHQLNAFFASASRGRGIRIIVFCVIALAGSVLAQECPDTLWTRIYDLPQGTGALGAYDMVQVNDGGWLLCGYKGYWPTEQMWFARTDSVGDTLWTKTYGDPVLNEMAMSICVAEDGNFIVAGFRGWGDPQEPGDSAVVLAMKMDIDGDTLWTRTYSCRRSVISREIVKVPSGGFAIVGSTNYFENFFDGRTPDSDSSDVFLLRINDTGDSVWSHTYGGTLADVAFCLEETRNGEFLLAGATGSYGNPTYGDFYAIKTDSLGHQIWSRTYRRTGRGQFAFAMDLTADGGFLLAGESIVVGTSADAYVVRCDGEGNMIWDSIYSHGLSSRATVIASLPGDTFVVGIASLRGIGHVDLYAIWATLNGTPYRDCTFLFPEPAHDLIAYAMQVTVDNKYMFCGDDGDPLAAAFFTQTETDRLPVDEPHTNIPREFAVAVFPNPFNSHTQINFSLPVNGSVCITLLNLMGQDVMTVLNRDLNSGNYSVSIDARHLSSGIYFLRISATHFQNTQKLVLLR
jgi:hypothetical protein